MHEYIRETSSWKYDACKCCNYRTPFTCVKCTYCWSCHWKKERIERNEFLRNRIRPTKNQRVTDQVVNNKTIATGVSQLQQDKMGSIQEQHLPKRTMINVFGEEEPDPICNYLGCNHAFSLHTYTNNHRRGACSCRHPKNSEIKLREAI